MLRCLIVDDSQHFVDAARRILERQGVSVVGVASTAAEALARVAELRPDVTLLDVNLGSESGFDLAARLHRGAAAAPPGQMILISTHTEDDYAEMIATSPAVGFITKSKLSADAIRERLGNEVADSEPPSSARLEERDHRQLRDL